jgi:hypothetical protein
MCPYYLDGETAIPLPRNRPTEVARLQCCVVVTTVQFSRTVEEAAPWVSRGGLSKLNSMRPAATSRGASSSSASFVGDGRPGPVDVPGRSGVATPCIPRET